MDISHTRSTGPGPTAVESQRLTDVKRLRRIRDRIDREYAKPLDVTALARGANMPAGLLSRAFRATYGQSPYAYLTARRMDRATLLLRGDLGVDAVCSAVGCATPGIFVTRFAELVGLTPEAFRGLASDSAGAGIESMPACVAQRVARAVRNQEAPAPGRPLA
ncbi:MULTISPECIES: helix-turn-helix transcriptional regulator [unclassified Streptomyces]|uniref:helix-turn-helix transcriptional regulator n=1 Tax=unclassified Streptomyces TaxID=2593676 RepID=UPI002ED46F34|nr:helix-turn-helix transcriptional regulator [Streptomyces sp. NBC_00891]WSY03701.1 helix-turn-helix transcriptional regulator [Streptomyces sp. NBC_00890]WSZ05327.1 helix-turn-helix transcriptional regulator [Streptomyces sp. NBC_00869]WSZ27177.1 helix-turn-helix transcriptional regulator [Streptomyces sp. NBC_00870]